MRAPRIILSGGGTGGHIFPAIAIANEICNRYPDAQILFVGAKGKMEMDKVPEAGYEIVGLWISGFQRRITWKNILIPFKLYQSLRKSEEIINDFRPDVVVGTGGYASGPLLKIALKHKVKTLIQEQNAFPGLTNKLLGKSADCVCVAFEGMERYFPKDRIFLTGNPVRKDIIDVYQKREEGIALYELNPNLKTVFIFGGSLGARTINESVLNSINHWMIQGFQIIWQTGIAFYESQQDVLKPLQKKGVKILPFIKRMDLTYAAADLIVSRAGAISISELEVVGKASILIPSPNVTDDHQTKNALMLAKESAAIMIKDADAMQLLGPKVIELLKDDFKLQTLAENIVKFAKPNAGEQIANHVINLYNQNQ